MDTDSTKHRDGKSNMDESPAVAERPTLKREQRKRLLQILGNLSSEDDSQSQQVVELRTGLARLAGLRPGEPDNGSVAVQGALDGVEFVVRGEIASGQSARLPQLLPSFVFLVLLQRLGKPEALREAERAARLLDRG